MHNHMPFSNTGIKVVPLGHVTLDINLGKIKLTHTFIACQNLSRPHILDLDFLHKFRIGRNCDKNLLFLPKMAK